MNTFRRCPHVSHRRCRLLLLSALIFASAAVATAADTRSLSIESVRIEIQITPDAQANVRQYYRFTKPLSAPEFRYLSDSCSQLGPVVIANPKTNLNFTWRSMGPWILFNPIASSESQAEYSTVYTAQLAGATANIPVLMPSNALASGQGYGKSVVEIHVVFPEASEGTDVVLPQMRQERMTWSGSFIAIPSFIRVRLGPKLLTRACVPKGNASGSRSSLEWLIYGFTGSLMAWIVLYMRWARSQ